MYDKSSPIYLFKYIIHNTKSMNIVIKHHFIRDEAENGDSVLKFVDSKNQLADAFTKPLLEEKFYLLRQRLDITIIYIFSFTIIF